MVEYITRGISLNILQFSVGAYPIMIMMLDIPQFYLVHILKYDMYKTKDAWARRLDGLQYYFKLVLSCWIFLLHLIF